MRENGQRSDFKINRLNKQRKEKRQDNMGKVEELRTKRDEKTSQDFKIDKIKEEMSMRQEKKTRKKTKRIT